MSQSRLELKVGVFVGLSLLVTAVIILSFTKVTGLFKSTVNIRIVAENVGGIVPGAQVLMAGVPIGSVTSISFTEDGHKVVMHARLGQNVRVHEDAIFSIRQSGFLGDRFISVTAGKNKLPLIQEGTEVKCEQPFDIEELATSVGGLLAKVKETVEQLQTSLARVDRTLLAEGSLANLTNSINNVRIVSEKAVGTVDNVNGFLSTNLPSISGSVSNMGVFSDQLNLLAKDFRGAIESNRITLDASMKNLEQATVQLNGILTDARTGKGLAANLLNNEDMTKQTATIISNISVLSSNLNKKGLLGVLRGQKDKK